MLNTFFFGYLSLKWKRLFRTLIIVAFHFWVWENVSSMYIELSLGFLVSIPLISWLLKPFVVKEE